ncbi:MAG: copper amine oxidase N-terminal domain-containing protein [Syntrophomonas sp.]|nr:copper amine oxidase N-terminal domain-containing protein [Syntrophomonas sp.]
MKKLILIIAILVLFIGSNTLTTLAISAPRVTLDGEDVSFDVPPITINGRTLVPLRAIFEAMGVTVQWNAETNTVTATEGTTTIVLQIDNLNATVNGNTVSLDVPAQIVNSRIMVPTRFIAESLGSEITWDADEETVVINSSLTINIDNSDDEYIKAENRRSILWIEKGYLSKTDILSIANKTETGINDIEKYIDRHFNKKINFYISGKKEPSYATNTNGNPSIYLSYVKEKKAPYIHESIHIIAGNCFNSWVSEGIAAYLNMKLNNAYPCYPNDGEDINKLAKIYLNQNSESVLKLIGENGRNDITSTDFNSENRKKYYILSASFVQYLDEQVGIQKIMRFYNERDLKSAMERETGKTVDTWKQAWIEHLADR